MTATMVISSQIVTEWIGNMQDSEQAELHFSTHTVCWIQLLQYVAVCHTQYHCYMVRKAYNGLSFQTLMDLTTLYAHTLLFSYVM